MSSPEEGILGLGRGHENDLLRADRYMIKGLRTVNPCVKKVFSKWVYGVLHGILTPSPKKVSQQLFGLIGSVLSKNKKVLLIDSLNTFNPDLLMKSFKLFSIDKKTEYSWFPENLFYSRPFQYLQFYSLLTEYIPEFLSKHGRATELLIITDVFRMFLDPSEHYFEEEYPEKHVNMLLGSLRVLRQVTYSYGVATIVLMDEKLFSIPSRDPFGEDKKLIRKKLPVEGIFPVLLKWEYEKGSNRLKVLKHFDQVLALECTDHEEKAVFQKKLDEFL